jgi:glutathione S-transferase
MLKLISATPSPYARKVRIALQEKGLPFELFTEVPWDSTTSTPKHNPLEKLPVLILDDGTSVYESSFILQYLELKYPDTPLLPAHVDQVLAARKLEVLCDGICDAIVLTFFERMRPGGGSAQWVERQQRKIHGAFAHIAEIIGDRQWAVGDRFSLGDIATGTVIGYTYVRLPEFELATKHPNLASYYERLLERPSFQSTIPRPQIISDKVV